MKLSKYLKKLGNKEPYEGLTHFPKGSHFEGLSIPRPAEARKSALRLIKALNDPTGRTLI